MTHHYAQQKSKRVLEFIILFKNSYFKHRYVFCRIFYTTEQKPTRRGENLEYFRTELFYYRTIIDADGLKAFWVYCSNTLSQKIRKRTYQSIQ